MAFFDKTINTPEAIERKEKEYMELISNKESAKKLWLELHEYFSNSNPRNDFVFYNSYWRWYTDLTWSGLNDVSQEDFVNIVIARQLPMATLLGFDVFKKIIWYLNFVCPEAREMESLFYKAREALLNSESAIGQRQNKEITMSDIIKEITLIENRGEDAMEAAELNMKLSEMIIPEEKYMSAYYADLEPEEIIAKLKYVINFFLGMNPSDVWSFVEVSLFPREYGEKAPWEIESEEIKEPVEKVGEKILLKTAEPIMSAEKTASVSKEAEIKKEIEIKDEKKIENIIEETKPIKPSTKEIKRMILERFPADADGQMENIEGVLAMLESFADEYEDAKIKEMYYFDETEGKFKWNV
ncbi:MAG: hypothetical protein WC430_01860 [Patescibacteria group bacterium]